MSVNQIDQRVERNNHTLENRRSNQLLRKMLIEVPPVVLARYYSPSALTPGGSSAGRILTPRRRIGILLLNWGQFGYM